MQLQPGPAQANRSRRYQHNFPPSTDQIRDGAYDGPDALDRELSVRPGYGAGPNLDHYSRSCPETIFSLRLQPAVVAFLLVTHKNRTWRSSINHQEVYRFRV